MLLPQLEAQPEAIADSTQILHSIESRFPSRSLLPADERKASCFEPVSDAIGALPLRH
jgi:glutathione S-transferase